MFFLSFEGFSPISYVKENDKKSLKNHFEKKNGLDKW